MGFQRLFDISLLFGALWLVSLAVPATAAKSSMTGYLIDKQCLTLCQGKPSNETCTPDSVNVLYDPQNHTGWCLLLQVCVDSGYVLMSEEPQDDGMHSVLLDLAGSQDAVVDFIKGGSVGTNSFATKKAFPLVVVEYEETEDGEYGALNAINAIVRDPDEWDSSYYTGEDTHQVKCATAADADIGSNNMCFRSDVVVTEGTDAFTIESNGCPDHPNMQGGKTVANTQTDACGTAGGCGCGGCGGCGACDNGGGCGGCGACGCGGCGACDNGSGCGGCGGCGACDNGSGCGGCGTCDNGGGCGGCGACDNGGGCGGCGACGCGGCGACGCGCGGCGTCGCGCGGKTSTRYTAKYQHYTMEIPKTPTLSASSTTITDDVVGITTSGVLIDSHAQTWSYDSCNGHADKKGQYHYHIPALCFMYSMGISFADSHTWWMNDDETGVRDYEEMPDQFPVTGPPSPVIGFARDGFPIFGLYDDKGDLQVSANLDECNGKEDSNGSYGYYITADPPFAPKCLKGEVGSFAYARTSIDCPAEGISNTILSESDVELCVTATARATGGEFPALSDCTSAPTSAPTESGVYRHAGLGAAGVAVVGALFI